MVMQEYTPNSHKYRESQKTAAPEQRQKVEKIVTGTVKTRQKSGLHKAAESFFNEDISSVKSYALYEVFIPGAKKLISEVFHSTVDAIFGTGRSSDRYRNEPKVSYRKYSDHYNDRRDDYPGSRVVRSRFDFDDIVFTNRGDAEVVLDRLDDLIRAYKYARVSDLYDAAGHSCPYTYNDYGWTSLRTAEIVRVSDGWIIKLPKAMPID